MLNVFIKKMINFKISVLTYVNLCLINTVLNNKFSFKKMIIIIKFSIAIFLKKMCN